MNRNPLELPYKLADEKCNARTSRGYCRNNAGFKTNHFGTGRCFLHGGRPRMNSLKKVDDSVLTSIYAKTLPTNLMIELTDLKSDTSFISLTQELALLKVFVNSLLNGLPKDLSTMFGKPVCSVCSEDIVLNDDDESKVLIGMDFREQRKLLDKIVSIVGDLSKVFEKLSRHEEKLGKFITISELETIFMRWGRILTKHFEGHPNLVNCQKEILECGWLREPVTEADFYRLDTANEIRNTVKKKIRRKKNKIEKVDAIAETVDEFLLDIEKSETKDGKPINNSKPKDALELLKLAKVKNNV